MSELRAPKSTIVEQPGSAPCEVILAFEKTGSPLSTTTSPRRRSQSVSCTPMRATVYFRSTVGPSIACDAIVEGNKLSGHFKPLKEWSPPDSEQTQVCVGHHKIEYGDILNAFVCISSPSDYHSQDNNCQTWVFKLLKLLNIAVPRRVFEIASGEATLRNLGSESEVPPEYRNQRCEVRLVFFQIGGALGSFLSWSGKFRQFMHWAVDIKLTDGYIYRCDGVSANGRLRGGIEITREEPPLKDRIVVGTFNISIRQIQHVVCEMTDCGVYHPIFNNTQTWAVKFIDKLNIPLPDGVQTIAEKVRRVFSLPSANDSPESTVHSSCAGQK